jgi:hypothetical protein
MTAKEVAAEYFGGTVSYWKILEEFKAGRLPGFKIGSRVFFRVGTLNEWLVAKECSCKDRDDMSKNMQSEANKRAQKQYGKIRKIV